MRDDTQLTQEERYQIAGVMKAAPAGLETMCLDGVLQPDWGGDFFLSEGVEPSGEQAFFAFHHRSAVTALTAPESGVEQVPEGVTGHVETVNDNRQAKPRPECQRWRHFHVPASFPTEHPSPVGNLDRQPESEKAQRSLDNEAAAMGCLLYSKRSLTWLRSFQ
jgi:hypothetical protein